MIDLTQFELRQLQLEAARALVVLEATNHNIAKFNKSAHHNSQEWYKAVIKWYIETYGDLPSKAGPGIEIKLIHDV